MTSLLRFSALALLLSIAPACGDDSKSPSDDSNNGDDDNSDSDNGDESGETKDAGKRDAGAMKDSSVTPPSKDGGTDAGKDGGSAVTDAGGLDAAVSKDAAVPSKDAEAPTKDAATAKDAAAPTKDAASPVKDAGGTSAMCENKICLDLADCYLFGNGFDCGFTDCQGFVCIKK